uniref:Uncharacterized protein n=1 Tax=Pseudomonas phage PACT201 TaxID=3230130 RepID=A0AAU8GTS8_9VIRU
MNSVMAGLPAGRLVGVRATALRAGIGRVSTASNFPSSRIVTGYVPLGAEHLRDSALLHAKPFGQISLRAVLSQGIQ